jgi:hypothetical protein
MAAWIRLMDLPHLMDNPAGCRTRRLDKLTLAHNSTATTAMKRFISARNERELPSGLQGNAHNPGYGYKISTAV